MEILGREKVVTERWKMYVRQWQMYVDSAVVSMMMMLLSFDNTKIHFNSEVIVGSATIYLLNREPLL